MATEDKVHPTPCVKATNPKKHRCLPPPEEFAEECRQAENRKKARARKPITTKEKFEAAQAAMKEVANKQAVAAQFAELGEHNSILQRLSLSVPRVKPTTKRPTSRKLKPPGLLATLEFGAPTSAKMPARKTKQDDGVLYRKTAWARSSRPFTPKPTVTWKTAPPVNGVTPNKLIRVEVKEPPPFPVLKLPREVRLKIWAFCVVRQNFIWPTENLGAEQMDLAMTCRQVRKEVLQIFYARNSFMIHMQLPIGLPTKESEESVKKHAEVLRIIAKWGHAIEQWIGLIQNWVLCYEYEDMHKDQDEGELLDITISQPNKFVISLQSTGGCGDASWRSDLVEIHREEACLLPTQPEYRKCAVKRQPGILNQAVFELDEMADKSGMTVDLIIGLAKKIMHQSAEILECKCESVVGSIE